MTIKIRLGILALTTFLLILLVYIASSAAGFSLNAPMLYIPALAQANDPPPPEPLILTDEQGEYPLGLHMEILEDPSGELTIEEVSSPEFDFAVYSQSGRCAELWLYEQRLLGALEPG